MGKTVGMSSRENLTARNLLFTGGPETAVGLDRRAGKRGLIKNHDDTTKHRATNYALEWIGQVPGKRESRRIDGLYQFTEHDIQANVKHADEISFGGWFVDLHTPGGLLAEHSEPAAGEGYREDSDYAAKSYVGPYGIPFRAHIATDVDNILLAGRCLSATHAALGTARVMATTAIVGQAMGSAAALALAKNLPLVRLPDADLISEIQQRLLRYEPRT